jgi:hypothetical protein
LTALSNQQPVTVTAAALSGIIRDALPFAATGTSDYPQLRGVCLATADNTLTATATDQHTIGQARTACVGDLGRQVVVGLQDAQLLADLFYGSAASVEINGNAPTVEITARPGGARFRTAGQPADRGTGLVVDICIPTASAAFPRFDHILTPPTTPAAPVALDRALLARFGRVTGLDQMIIHPAGPDTPVYVEIGDRFVGAIMPMRMRRPPRKGDAA